MLESKDDILLEVLFLKLLPGISVLFDGLQGKV